MNSEPFRSVNSHVTKIYMTNVQVHLKKLIIMEKFILFHNLI